MNTNMTGFRWFQKSLRTCALDESSLRIVRVNWVKVCVGGGAGVTRIPCLGM